MMSTLTQQVLKIALDAVKSRIDRSKSWLCGMLGMVRKNLQLQKFPESCCAGCILWGSDGLILALKNNNGERQSKFSVHIFWCFASSKFTSGTRSKSESLRMLSKRWLVWVLRARWYGGQLAAGELFAFSPAFLWDYKSWTWHIISLASRWVGFGTRSWIFLGIEGW